ncbi:unnamed protein product, partial [Effrenium voratum]
PGLRRRMWTPRGSSAGPRGGCWRWRCSESPRRASTWSQASSRRSTAPRTGASSETSRPSWAKPSSPASRSAPCSTAGICRKVPWQVWRRQPMRR